MNIKVNLSEEAKAYNEKCEGDSSTGIWISAGAGALGLVGIGAAGIGVYKGKPIKLPQSDIDGLKKCEEIAKKVKFNVENAPEYCCEGYAFPDRKSSTRLYDELIGAKVPKSFIQEYDYKTYMDQRARSLRDSAEIVSDASQKQYLLAQADECAKAAQNAKGTERIVKVLNPSTIRDAISSGGLALPEGVTAKMVEDFASSSVDFSDEIFRSFGKSTEEIASIHQMKLTFLKKLQKLPHTPGVKAAAKAAAKATGSATAKASGGLLGLVRRYPKTAIVLGLGGVYCWKGDKLVEYVNSIGGDEHGASSLPKISEEILKELETNYADYGLDANTAKSTIANVRAAKELDSDQYSKLYSKSEPISQELEAATKEEAVDEFGEKPQEENSEQGTETPTNGEDVIPESLEGLVSNTLKKSSAKNITVDTPSVVSSLKSGTRDVS